MNAQPSSFRPAQRAGVGLLISISGETGSGKTLSALLMARGLAAEPHEDLKDPSTLARVDARIAFIDTEAGRALHYAPPEGQLPSKHEFGFAHCDLQAPFSPEAYQAKIEEADRAGFRVIIVDSFSHEWDGEGGCSDIHDEDLEAMVAASRKKNGSQQWWDEAQQREKLSMTAWKGPKMRHKRMVSRLLQCRAHIVVCMRAEDKLRIETVTEQGRNGREFTKTTVTPAAKLPPRDRWVPICEKRFPFQLITSLVVTPDHPGMPIALKLQEQHKAFIREDRLIDEAAGRGLAAWALGAKNTSGSTPTAQRTKPTNSSAFSPLADDAPAADPAHPANAAGAPPSDDMVEWSITPDPLYWDPQTPQMLPTPTPGQSRAWQMFAKALRQLITRAPDKAAKFAWWDLNAPTLKIQSENAHAWVREAMPDPNATDGDAASVAELDL